MYLFTSNRYSEAYMTPLEFILQLFRFFSPIQSGDIMGGLLHTCYVLLLLPMNPIQSLLILIILSQGTGL